MKDTACIPAIEKDFQKTLEFCRDVEPTRESIWEGNGCSIWQGFYSKLLRRYCKTTFRECLRHCLRGFITNNPYPSRSPGR